jgi:uncharacterized protein
MHNALPEASPDEAVAEVRAWVDRAVIGLNLCPFAKAVQAKRLIRYVGTAATDTDALRDVLVAELERLRDTDSTVLETTLLVHPRVLQDFLDYNDFLDEADAVVAALGLDGVIQVASFHPDYRFAGTAPDDMGNATNRAPYPTLHLLRESSIDRAVAAFPEADAIYEANIATMQSLGPDGWAALRRQCREEAGRRGLEDGGPAPVG